MSNKNRNLWIEFWNSHCRVWIEKEYTIYLWVLFMYHGTTALPSIERLRAAIHGYIIRIFLNNFNFMWYNVLWKSINPNKCRLLGRWETIRFLLFCSPEKNIMNARLANVQTPLTENDERKHWNIPKQIRLNEKGEYVKMKKTNVKEKSKEYWNYIGDGHDRILTIALFDGPSIASNLVILKTIE